MRTYVLAISLALLWAGIRETQATPTVVNTNLQIRLVFNTPSSSTTIKMAKDPRNNQLYFLKVNGNIYSVNLTNSSYTQVYSSSDHGLTSGDVEGLCIGPDGTMYVEADYANGKYGSAKIAKGVLNGSGVRVWSVLAQTDQWPKSGGAYDHNDSEIIASLDGQTLYLNCGSRTDHGEIENNGGTFPNTRDVGLTAKILQMPTSGNNLFLTNDLPTLLAQGYVFVQGTRNAFSFAYAPNGDLFATENGPDRDMSDSFYWLRAGCHYGFPWRMGGMQNPQQYSNYNPANDPLLNPAFGAVSGGLYANDPTFPPPPTNFTDPVINLGPSADIYRNQTNGAFINAGQTGTSLNSFTAHSSPCALAFDTAGAMGGGFQYHGFCCRWTPGDPTGDTVAGPFYDASQDLLDLNLTKVGTNYQMYATTLVSGFANPIAAEVVSNKVYVAEYGGNQGLWEITFPTVPAAPTATQLVVLQQPPAAGAAGVSLVQQPVVAAEDNTGDIMTNYTGTITASETAGGTLNATSSNAVTVTVSNGIAAFAGLYVTNIANGVTLTFTSGTLVSTNSTAFNVSALASQLLQVGVGYTVHLNLVDQYQNPSAFSGTKMLMFNASLSPAADGSGASVGGGTQGTAVPVTFSHGTAVVTLVAHKAESGKTITVTDGTLSSSSPGGAALALKPIIPAPDNAYQMAVATTNPPVQTNDALTLYLVDQYQNPSTYWGGKNLTATGLSAGPSGTPASVNGTAFGTATPVNFTAGTGSATLVAQRAEDSKLLAVTDGTLSSTNAGGAAPLLSPRGVVLASTAYFYRPRGLSLLISISDLLTNATDIGSSTLGLAGVSSPSTNGIIVTNNSTYVLYAGGTNNVTDSFNYYAADAYGGSATGLVVISIVGGQTGQSNATVTMTNSVATITFAGVPGDTYVARRATNLTPPVVWVNLSTNIAPAIGLFQVNDNFNDLGAPPAQAYYELQAP